MAERLRAIRANEGLTQVEFCKLVGMSLNTYKKYETGVFEMGYGALSKLLAHPRFKPYALWLMTDETAPSYGQVGPT
ncbi:hypothetical protein D9M69_526320 [compost metagenome]